MLDQMLLAITSRCADIAVCPSDSELISALIVHDETSRKVIGETAARKGEIVLFHLPQGPYGLTNVACGGRELGEQPTVTCKLVARYETHDAPQVTKLVRQSGTWRIVDKIP